MYHQGDQDQHGSPRGCDDVLGTSIAEAKRIEERLEAQN